MNKYEDFEHQPVIFKIGDKMLYDKVEINDNFFHRITGAISIEASLLEDVDEVVVHVVHRGTTVRATKEEIKSFCEADSDWYIRDYHGEKKYYYPVGKWHPIVGRVELIDGNCWDRNRVVEGFGKRQGD